MKLRHEDPNPSGPRRVALVVGNNHAFFGERHPDAFTITTFLTRFGGEPCPFDTVHIGQGLSPREVEALARKTRCCPGEAASYPKLATSRMSHKHEEHNIMVSEPRKGAEDKFELDLRISSKAAEVSDHQTGEHLSGASLEEAARQALLVVTEHYFIPVGESSDYYFVTRSKDVKFLRFAFPLPTVLEYEILGFKADEHRNLSFDVQIAFRQAGYIVMVVRFAFAVYRKSWLSEKEHELAAEALDAVLGRAIPASAIDAGGALPEASEQADVRERSVEGGRS
jgi:hypothetical protein